MFPRFGGLKSLVPSGIVYVWYWVIIGLVGILWFRNIRYSIRHYLSERNFVYFMASMVLLLGLGYLLVHETTRFMSVVQASQEVLNNS